MLPAEAPRARRRLRPLVRALSALALAGAALAACGEGEEAGDTSGGPPTGESRLEVILAPRGPEGPQRRAVASCEGEARGCKQLEALRPTDLYPVDPGTACTEIYGGPDEVRVTGTLDGERVDALLTRVNGCEIDRFERIVPPLRELFPGYRPGRALGPA